ncbi:hypothetical protein GCM10011391_38090 [Pullulanibacillus camelliae]|uniref:Uncharacterized protein n=1 Tax=Pullulanibacillus camelliae TaxID=1707096 RepID=A0A8J3E0U9_9BACL|nr:hypothetical protein GCM10011391_38090 [Pullulanibacillus camelliae]
MRRGLCPWKTKCCDGTLHESFKKTNALTINEGVRLLYELNIPVPDPKLLDHHFTNIIGKFNRVVDGQAFD